jgi:hypothetical protein
MQMPDNNRDRDSDGLEAPPELVSALKRLSKPPIFIPAMIDDAIAHATRRRLSPHKEPRFKWTIIFRWAAALAALVLLLAIIPQFLRKSGSAPDSRFAIGDVNHDGKVDILDAFALAKKLKAGTPPNPQLDINGDGVVDERDVATVAAQAVRLEKGGRS